MEGKMKKALVCGAGGADKIEHFSKVSMGVQICVNCGLE